MIFAFADWLKYVSQSGCYSPDVLTRMGAIHAKPETYDTFVASVLDGDFLFVHPTKSTVGWAIMYLTHGPWSHVASLTGSGTVYEAVATGVGEYPLRKYFDGRHYVSILRLPLSDEQLKNLKTYYENTRGQGYGYHKIVRLFLLTIFNGHPDYRLKFTADILIFLSLAALLAPFRAVQLVLVLLGILYLIILGFDSLRRVRAALRFHRDYLEVASPMFQEPRNSSPNRMYRYLLRQPDILVAETLDDK